MGGNTASRSSGDDYVNTTNLPPLTFHASHGENVRLLRDGAVAKRVESFCKGLAFSSRPVNLGERVFVKFSEVSSSWSGVARIGFSTTDPNALRGCLPKYACPDLTNKPGCWAKALPERYVTADAVVSFHVTAAGEVMLSVNGDDKGVFFSGVETRSGPLWAVIDIYGNTVAVELLANTSAAIPRTVLNNVRRRSEVIEHGVDAVVEQLGHLSASDENIQRESLHVTYNRVPFRHMSFHRTRGLHALLSHNATVATRKESEFANGYVFTARPMWLQERIVIQVLQTDRVYVGGLAFGLTSCNPDSLVSADLPDDSNLLLDRPEYWVVHKDVANSPQCGDELSYSIERNGEVQFFKNGNTPITIMHVDQSQKLWAFFDIYGNTTKIRLLGVTVNQIQHTDVPGQSGKLRVSIPPWPFSSMASSPTSFTGTSLATSSERLSTLTVTHGSPRQILDSPLSADPCLDNASNECSVCYDQPVDSVLYACGHMCMCYNCAVGLWKRSGGGQCPICRADIKDVIRTYRS